MAVSVNNNFSLAADSVAHYLKGISRVPLLAPSEEIELAHHVQAMKKLLKVKELDRTPKQLRHIRMGQRAFIRFDSGRLRRPFSCSG